MSYKISYNKNENKQIEQAIKVLTSWIGEPDSNSTRTFTLLTIQNNSAEIEKSNLEEANHPKKIDDFFIFSVKDEIKVVSMGDRGLANGIYHLHMKLKEQQIHDPFSMNWNLFQTPYFESRGITSNFPFRLEGLSPDTWTFSQWKEYLNRVRSFNYTKVLFLIGAWMQFHPDIEELRGNSWRYDVAEEAFKYAADIGLEIILLDVFNQINTNLWIKYPEIRSTVFMYQGLSYCSKTGTELGEKLLKYTLNRFKKDVRSNALFAFEGAGCNCEYCRNNVVDLINKYLEFIRENAEPEQLFFFTWFANIKENFETPAIKGLREKLFSTLPKDIKIIDVNRKTLQMAVEQGYEIYDFIFFTDPEAGMENQSIFPKPHLNMLKERISDSIKEFGSKLKGVFGYRLMPKARFINDYALGRYLWNPEIEVDEIVSEVSGLLSSSIQEKEQITRAIFLLEGFWRENDGKKLKECDKILKAVVKQNADVLEPLRSIHEAINILKLLFKYYSHKSERRRRGILQKIHQRMRDTEMFHCYTSYKFWDVVSLEMIKQRVEWWTDPKSGLFGPQAFPWNIISKGKYHLIDNKKDVLPWMTFSEMWSGFKLVISQKFKHAFRKKK